MAEFNYDNINNAAKACERFERLIDDHPLSRSSRLMDLAAADGMNGNDLLDWARLLTADGFNFIHDVGGIHQHMDRSTGTIGDCFVPRMTK